MRTKWFLFILAAILFSRESHAYVRTMADSGTPIFWSGANPVVRINPTNSSGLSSAQVSSMINGALASWNNSGASVNFSYSTATNNPTQGAYDGANAAFFASNSPYDLGWGVVAVTEVIYFVNNGQIAEFDMIFNDRQFNFTAHEGDTGNYINGKTAIYLQDVATHEAGHALGLDHTLVNKSSLIYTAFSGQFNLSDDDKSGAQTMYPNSLNKGSITGNIRGLSGGIFGAQITAINPTTGNVQAAILSNSDGSFRIGDLPAGEYLLLMEPFGTDVSSVTGYYQNVNHRFCSGSKFRRRFYSACGSNHATLVNVTSGNSSEIGTITPSCSQMGNPNGASTNIGSAKEISASGGSYYGTMSTNESHYYKVRSVSGNISVKAASYSLYSPIDVRVDILSSSGSSIGASTIDNVENPMPGGFINYDASAQANNLPNGDYIIKVTSASQRVPSSNFSAGYDLLDSSGHYLLMVAINGSYGPTSITDMSGCISVNNVVQNASYRAPSSTSDKERNAGGGCGSLASHNNGGPFSGGLSQALFAIILIQIITYFAQRQQKRKLARKPL